MPDNVSKSERSRIMALVKSKDTTPELVVRHLVRALGYRYRLHVKSLPGTPDLVFPRLKKVIEVRGCFWHGHQVCGRCRIPNTRRPYWLAKIARNKSRDRRAAAALRRLGYARLTVWECHTRPDRLPHLRQRLAAFLARP